MRLAGPLIDAVAKTASAETETRWFGAKALLRLQCRHWPVGLIPSRPMARVLIERRLTRVALRNYKCIASCDVKVRPLSVLVGPNGSGKSSFLDALRLVSDALRYSLDHALQERGGFAEVRRRTSTTAGSFAVVLRLRLPARGAYGCVIARNNRNGYVVSREQCVLSPGADSAHYRVDEGVVVGTSIKHPPNARPDELYLSRIASIPPFDQVYGFLSNMTFYNPSVDRIRELQTSDEGRLLKRDGSNVASVLNRLKSVAPERKRVVDDYLAVLVPQVDSVEPRALGPKMTVEFRQRMRGSDRARRFLAESMSDGTLRALGVLVALFQQRGVASAIGVEEPELGLHAGALGGLADALLEASQHLQTFATTHSAEMLDSQAIPFKYVLGVESHGGETRIGPLDQACFAALRDGRFTVGELLRMGQTQPDPDPPRPLFPREITPRSCAHAAA